MRTTTSGRAFAKVIFDLFSTLMVSLPIENHKILFRTYPNSFTAEEAIANLGGLQFIQSNRDTDPKDPTRIITHVVTTQFSLSRDMAKNLCQTFMDARLFENAVDPNRREFQNKGIYQVTPKGAHILAKFVHRNALPVDETRHITANASANLVYLERADDEDAIILTQKQVDTIFKRFAGAEPNIARTPGSPTDSPMVASPGSSGRDRTLSTIDLCKGIEVKDQQHNYDMYKHTFYGKSAVEWLLDYTTVISKEEATRISQEMVTGGYIEQVGEDSKASQALFRTGNSALYHLTELGRSIAGWKSLVSSSGSSVDNDWMDERGNVPKSDRTNNEALLLSQQFKMIANTVHRLPISIAREAQRSTEDFNNAPQFNEDSGRAIRRLSQILNDPAFQINLSDSGAMSSYAPSSAGRESVGVSSGGGHSSMSSSSQSTTSNTTRLNIILSNATLRDLFKSFLKQNICEENLSFYLEVLDFRSKFNTLINSTRAYTQSVPGQDQTILGHTYPPALRELEKQICKQAFAIFETYLALGSSREVNLPHQMRADITAYMQAVIRNMEHPDDKTPLPSAPSSPSSTAAEANDSAAIGGTGKELIHIALFDDIHDHIFRLMSTDSVPKFTKTDKYREVMMNRVKQGNNTGTNSRINQNGGGTVSGSGGESSIDGKSVNGSGPANGGMSGVTSPGGSSGGMRSPTSGSSRNEERTGLRRSISFNGNHRRVIQAEQVVAAQLSFGSMYTNQVGQTKQLPSLPLQNPAVNQLRVPRLRSVSSTGTVPDSRRAQHVQHSAVQTGITVPRYQPLSQFQSLQVRTALNEQSVTETRPTVSQSPMPTPKKLCEEQITVHFESTSFSIQDEGSPGGVSTALSASSSDTSSTALSSYPAGPQFVANSQPELSSSSPLPTLSPSSSVSSFTSSLATPKSFPDISANGAFK